MGQDLNVEYHQQEDANYCGAASAQMVLLNIGVPHTANPCQDTGNVRFNCAGNTDLCQRCLYEESRNSPRQPTEVWFSYPDALTNTLNNRRPPAFAQRFRFVLFEELQQEVINHKICWTIKNYAVPPIVNTGKNGLNLHWIVVKGYDSPIDPQSSSADTSFHQSIRGFWVHDPWPSPGIPANPPPHDTAANGDLCGLGMRDFINRGTANEYIAIADWNQRVMVPPTGGHWAGKYLAICDPEKGPEKLSREEEVYKIFTGDSIISSQRAASLAMRAIVERKIIDKTFVPTQIKKAVAGKPLLVKRMDEENQYYYIVPLNSSNGRCYGRVMIDARHGNFLRATFPNRGGRLAELRLLTKREILNLLGNEVSYNKEEKIKIFPEAVSTSPVLVWMHCYESLSPFYPFQLITIGDKQLYLRIDDPKKEYIFPKLTFN